VGETFLLLLLLLFRLNPDAVWSIVCVVVSRRKRRGCMTPNVCIVSLYIEEYSAAD